MPLREKTYIRDGFVSAGDAEVTGSLGVSGTITGNLTGDVTGNASTATSATTATSASFASTASFYGGSVTSASFASTASSLNPLNQDIRITGSVTHSGSLFEVANNGGTFRVGKNGIQIARTDGAAIYSTLTNSTSTTLDVDMAIRANNGQYGNRSYAYPNVGISLGYYTGKWSAQGGGTGATQVFELSCIDASNTTNFFLLKNGSTQLLVMSSSGNLLIGTGNTSTYRLDVSGSGNYRGSLTVTGSLIVSNSSDTQMQVGSNLLFVSNSGNVGIGTTSPTHLLDVKGVTRVQKDGAGSYAFTAQKNISGSTGTYNSTTANTLTVTSTGTTGYQSAALTNNLVVNQNAGLNYLFGHEWSAMTNNLSIQSYGSVAAGADRVANTVISTTVGYNRSITDTLYDLYFLYYNYGSVATHWGIYHSATDAKHYFQGKLMTGTGADLGYQFRVSGSSGFTGNMNITGSASNSLRVKGSGATSATNTVYVENSSGQNTFLIRDDGNVGIGTASPLTKLQVVGGNDQGVYSTSTNNIAINGVGSGVSSYGIKGETDLGTAIRSNITNTSSIGLEVNYTPTNNSLFKVLGDGSVGIGTASPLTKLHVNGNTLITGSLTVGSSSLGSNENTLVLGPAPAGGTGEGGQILLQAPGGTYTSASMWDNYQNSTRLLRGTNNSSDAVVASFNMHTKQVQFAQYNSTSAFTGTVVGLLGFDSNGMLLTTTASGGGGGSGTVNSGTSAKLAYYPSTGTAVDDATNLEYDGTNLKILSTGQLDFYTDLGSIYFGNFSSPSYGRVGFSVPGAAVMVIDYANVRAGFGGGTGLITSAPGALVDIQGKANEIQLLIKGNGTQTANVFEIRDSSNTQILTLDNGGVFNTAGGGTSDRRKKDNIMYLSYNHSNIINALKPAKFEFKNNPGVTRHGFIAQDVLEVKPDLVLGNGEEEDGTYGLDYDGILAITVKSLQEALARISQLEQTVEELKKQ